MITLDQVHETGTELEMWPRMRVHPVAVKLLKNREQVPDGVIIRNSEIVIMIRGGYYGKEWFQAHMV
jgi:hypothetical protein